MAALQQRKNKRDSNTRERPSCLAVVVQAVQQHPAPGVANGQVPAVWAEGRALNVVQRRLGCRPVAEDSHGGDVDHPASAERKQSNVQVNWRQVASTTAACKGLRVMRSRVREEPTSAHRASAWEP